MLFNFSFSTLVIIDLKQSLDKYINIKVTKGNKKTLFNIPSHLVELLAQWKTIQNPEQLILPISIQKVMLTVLYTLIT